MIERDGTCTSLWQQSMPPYEAANEADPSSEYDVIVIGGGITGVSTAWLLQKAGKRCLVIEARCLGFGTTGGTTAHINTLFDTSYATISQNFGDENAQRVADMAKEAIELIKRNIKELSIDCDFKELPAFIFSQGKEQSEVLQAIYKGSKKLGLDIAYTKKIPVPMPFNKAIQVEGQAQFNPMQYVYALATAFENEGGTIVQETRVLGVDGDDVLTITTNGETFKGKAVIYATHIPTGINLLHLRCAPYRTYAMAVTLLHKSNYPQGLIYDCDDPYHYYRTQEVDGELYLVAGGYDHRTAGEENTERCFLQLEAHLRKYFEIAEVKYAWSSQYFEPSDGLPYIGHLPGHPGNIYVATGFGGNGMTYSSMAATILKSMILGEEDTSRGLFDPNRIKPVAGFVNFIKHNGEVAKNILGKLWPVDKLNGLASMAPGEGRIVKYDGEMIALHKDEHGILHGVHPHCSHMQCTIAWNSAESSWDCPCHGARFDIDGQVLTGPASIALDKVIFG